MIAARFGLTLTVQGPVITNSSTLGDFGIDSVMARTGGHFHLPGTLIKGLVGEAWQELGSVDERFRELRRRWFGDESRIQNLPIRGLLFFEDLLDPKTPVNGARTHYRIEIDDTRGSVEHGHYQVIEAPYRSGEEVVFEGVLWLLGENREQAEAARKDVQTALRWVTAVGAERSVGFGRVLSAECGAEECLDWPTTGGESDHTAFDLELRFNRPVCFARRRLATNLFESESTISGAALKGALATLVALDVKRWPNLAEQLHAVRFTHAFPALEGGSRPKFPPDSLVQVENRYYDVLFAREPVVIGDEAPAFRVDWKDKERGVIWDLFGWPDVERELRVRTAIEGQSRRAKEGSLFAYQMIVPEGLCWYSTVSLEGVSEGHRSAVAAELTSALHHGLFALGKTKARAKVKVNGFNPEWRKLTKDHVALTLQTPALLCNPDEHIAPDGRTGSGTWEVMESEYRRVWHSLSGGALDLQNYFHGVSLAGGDYIRHRFQNGKPYRPYLMTDAGSVFLLKVIDAPKAEQHINEWLQRGLPVREDVRHFYLLDDVPDRELWKYCPFLPENGFGEIAVDLHDQRQAEIEVWNA